MVMLGYVASSLVFSVIVDAVSLLVPQVISSGSFMWVYWF